MMHSSMKDIEDEFFHVEEKEELPEDCPDIRTCFCGHKNVEFNLWVNVDENKSKESVINCNLNTIYDK